MLGDGVIRGTTLTDIWIALFYCFIGILIGLVLIAVALVTASSTNVVFPTSNDGSYGFLMKSVQSRVPLASVGGASVSAPTYNDQYSEFGVSSGAPINPTLYYTSSVPFSTSAWWSRLVNQKALTNYNPSMPYMYCGTFNLYRSKSFPSFAITIARPYSLGGTNIKATKVCGQQTTGPTVNTRAFSVQDGAPTCFTAPILWSETHGRPYHFSTEMTYSAKENGNMTCELSYSAALSSEAMRITLTQLCPYLVYTLAPGSSISLNSLYRDQDVAYVPIKLINIMSSAPLPLVTPNSSFMIFRTDIVSPPVGSPPFGLSQSSIVEFQVSFYPPCTVTQLTDFTVIIKADSSSLTPTRIMILPSRYYIADPKSSLDPTSWVNLDHLVKATILGSLPVKSMKAFVSATSSNGNAIVTYSSDAGQPLFFVPSLTMHTVGTINGASPVTTLPPYDGVNYWLTPQGGTSVYVAPTGRFDVSYPLFEPPAFGTFDIYSAFDANSLKRLNFIFNRDLEALYSVDIANDSFYVSVRKIFTLAQMTYAIFNFPATVIVNAYLPSMRAHLLEVFDALLQSDRAEVRLGYNPVLFTVATGDQQYGSSQNQVFGDNHIGQYGMLLFTYYIIVSIQFDNSSRRAARDRYQTVMVDLMRDFAQPYLTDSYIPSMRHFDYGMGLSWQTSSIIEASSLQVSEVINGYYACWLVASLFGDNKLRDYYRAILSIEMATHQEYRLASLAPQGEGSLAPIYQMINQAEALYQNAKNIEFGCGPPGAYKTLGTVVYLIQGSEIILHGVSNDHPDYRYLLDNINPNTVADFSATTFYRPMTPITIHMVPLTLGINLNSFQTVVFTSTQQLVGLGSTGPVVVHSTHLPQVLAYDTATGLPAHVLTLENNPASFMTIEAAYSLSSYATHYITNYTWAGANLPDDACAIIPDTDLPSYLSPVLQYNKLGLLDSNTVMWIQFVITAHGPR